MCATSSRVCYCVVPALGLEIYYLGYGANGGHIKLQNRPLLHPSLFLFHGWHFILYLLSLFYSSFPPSFLLLALALFSNENSNWSFVFYVGLSSFAYCVFFEAVQLLLVTWQSETVTWNQGCLSLVAGLFHFILLALQSKNSWRILTCGWKKIPQIN